MDIKRNHFAQIVYSLCIFVLIFSNTLDYMMRQVPVDDSDQSSTELALYGSKNSLSYKPDSIDLWWKLGQGYDSIIFFSMQMAEKYVYQGKSALIAYSYNTRGPPSICS